MRTGWIRELNTNIARLVTLYIKKKVMIKPEFFDIIELLINLPEAKQFIGSQGSIVECFEDGKYEVEFSNNEGETTALCTLSEKQFIVVWQAKTKSWIPVSERLNAVINNLSENQQQELLNFARFIHQVS
ncbi:hypothetical protein CWATWH0005_941 [Crocosphaera watsonii WH 0005]|uniref:DUF4926 domain-containing protein n=3 Tax=Crocosphaera watsonii TaxID=263511 RepID=T2ITV8_CROWT|nr:hypothetical protein CWATWH0005_941 [Crocosphaera watsonii WH 0005]